LDESRDQAPGEEQQGDFKDEKGFWLHEDLLRGYPIPINPVAARMRVEQTGV
jgi:hypothetical protein